MQKLSVKKFRKAIRRKLIVAHKRMLDRFVNLAAPSRRHILKKSEHYKFLARWKKQHSEGIKLWDGKIATIENRWVRKALRKNPR